MTHTSHVAACGILITAVQACTQDTRPFDFNPPQTTSTGAQAANSAGQGANLGGQSTSTATPISALGGSSNLRGTTDSSLGGTNSPADTASPTTGGMSNPSNTTSPTTGGTSTGGTSNPAGSTTNVSVGGAANTQTGAAGSSATLAACQLPIDVGICAGSSGSAWRFGFNPNTQRCEKFRYSGCSGNANRFDWLEDCIAACDPGGYDACNVDTDCALAQPGCCGSCEPHLIGDFEAVNVRYTSVNSCTKDVSCGACATYTGTPTAPYFGAQCVAGRCQAYDSRELPGTVCDPDARAAGNSEYAMEIARGARPTEPIRIMLLLTDPGSGAGKTVEERQAELAPTQDPIVALLTERGATRIERYWLINAISAELQAQYLLEAMCWPSVTGIETDVLYWDVADRPWDVTTVGTEECPRTGTQCPNHCELMYAEPFDPAAGCTTGTNEPLACSINDRLSGFGYDLCGANSKTGRVYCEIPNFTPRDPAFLGWRACTAEEAQRCVDAAGRRCP